MKLGPVTKLDKRNKILNDDTMSENYDIISNFPIDSQFGAIQKLDSGSIVCKTYIFINSNLLSYKTEHRTKKSLTHPHTTALSKGIILAKKCCFLPKKMLTSVKLRGPWY